MIPGTMYLPMFDMPNGSKPILCAICARSKLDIFTANCCLFRSSHSARFEVLYHTYRFCTFVAQTPLKNDILCCFSAVDDHGEMRVDAQSWAAAAIETKSDEKEISRAIKVYRINLVRFLAPWALNIPVPGTIHAHTDNT